MSQRAARFDEVTSKRNELAVLRVLQRACEDKLLACPTTAGEDEAKLRRGDAELATLQLRNATRVVCEEKRVLLSVIELCGREKSRLLRSAAAV